eukprot:gnl/MRDRNA2_/MRDRNA2_73095_c0_seq1.p1 gnl/MRDRNA2_/MRDRNA2_73095_c0~~gnl/MRDRNA2_/MRDRNA2_73095_c0_seq1.p1  ORF type:complete len:1176 (-),score=234.25 gnl/MRDRNA2_/MRDRNA2_73095_c0_seq1:30-3557(-)
MVCEVAQLPLLVDPNKKNLSDVLEFGKQKMHDGHYEAAIAHFTHALQLNGSLCSALVSRGFCHLSLGDHESALPDFAEVIATDSGFDRNVYILIALCYKWKEDYATAIRYLTRGLMKFPSFKTMLVARGELHLKTKNYEKALLDFRQILSESPQLISAHRGYGDALRGLGDYRDALRQYTKAIEGALSAYAQLNAEEQALEPGGRDSGTSDDRTPSPDEGPSTSDPSEHSRSAEHDHEERATAVQSSSGTRHADEDQLALSQDTGGALLGQGAQSAAAQLQAAAIEAFMRRALLLRLLGDLQNAGGDLLEVLQMDNQNGLAMFWYGKILIEQQRRVEAVDFLKASLQYLQDEKAAAEAHVLLGALLMTITTPDFELALEHIKTASRLAPKSKPVMHTKWICTAAVALHETPKDPEKALSYLEKTLSSLTKGGREAEGGRTSRSSSQHKAASPEELRWSTAKEVSAKRQSMAQCNDLEPSLGCTTYLQAIASDNIQRQSPVPVLLYLLRAAANAELCHWEEVLTDSRKALALDPENTGAQFNKHVASGILRSWCSEYEAAIGHFTKAIRLRPHRLEPKVHRAIATSRAAHHYSSREPEKVRQLLADSLRDLDEAQETIQILSAENPESQARTAGRVQFIRAICLYASRRHDDAFDALASCDQLEAGHREDAQIRQALRAEILCARGDHRAAIAVCNEVIEAFPETVETYLTRGRCWSELGEREEAFADFRRALVLAPENPDTHFQSAQLFFSHRQYREAIQAYSTAQKLGGSMNSKLSYQKAIACVACGNLQGALKELQYTLQINPAMTHVAHARDGLTAIQSAITGDFKRAVIRLNTLLNNTPGNGRASSRTGRATLSVGAPTSLLSLYELMLYRGVCFFYLEQAPKAMQDFETALELCLRLQHLAEEQREAGVELPEGLPPELHPDGHIFFECEVLYNVALANLLDQNYMEALDRCQRLIEIAEREAHARTVSGITSPISQGDSLGLVWFLAGLCQLALDEVEASRESFMRSYSYHPTWVDDFLHRHEPSDGRPPHMGGGNSRATTPLTPTQRFAQTNAWPHTWSNVGRVSSARDQKVETPIEPWAVCCLFGGEGTNRLSQRFPTKKIEVRDVTIFVRPSFNWPFVSPPEGSPQVDLSVLRLCEHHEVYCEAERAWEMPTHMLLESHSEAVEAH